MGERLVSDGKVLATPRLLSQAWNEEGGWNFEDSLERIFQSTDGLGWERCRRLVQERRVCCVHPPGVNCYLNGKGEKICLIVSLGLFSVFLTPHSLSKCPHRIDPMRAARGAAPPIGNEVLS